MAKRHIRLGTMLALTLSCVGGVGCQDIGEDAGDRSEGAPALRTSEQALARVAEIRARFRIAAPDGALLSGPAARTRNDVARALRRHDGRNAAGGAALATRPVIGPARATRFVPSPGGERATHVRAEILGASEVARAARVDLPRDATGSVHVEDAASRVRVGFALRDAKSAPATEAGGYTLYSGAAGGADVVHRVHAEGTEDYVVFEKKPTVAALAYDVDLTNVAGLRLVDDSLEFLDAEGSPSLRVAPPYVVDAKGTPHAASLAVEGCAYDTNAAPPWGRAVTSPGASRCTVRVAWGEVTYPALVDPSWTTTGSMQSRWLQSSTPLASGKVLVSGGYNMETWEIRSSAEIYNPSTGTFAATGSLAFNSIGHSMTLLASGQVLVTGGDPDYGMGSYPYSDAQIFDESAGTFTSIGPMSAARRFQSATRLASGKVLVVGGRIFATGPEAEIFDPATNTFSAPSMPFLGSDEGSHTATLLTSGKVLLTSGETRSTLVYDPAAGTFSASGLMSVTRNDPGSVRLASGRVLVFGGYDASGNLRLTAEVYNPTTGAFAATGAMQAAQQGAEAVLLPSGSVLLVGYGTSTQLYNPGTNAFTWGLSSGYEHYNPVLAPLSTGKILVAGGDAWGGESYSVAELYTP